ncbi:uncharacterized protein [Diabrotica undecimpunctata]|uniref:uncharacterized protein n=1 Tax=Diabrotica undecimpunctata TaxID=50387 RepID=UPI003B63C57D
MKEAGIQSAKFYLRRVIGNAVLTYESFNTILCQIEAILNSRPLFRISECPEDLSFLCPAHFLVGQPLLAPPEPSNILEIPENRLSLYQKLSQMQLLFWKKWSVSYLQTIQSRSKWRTVTQSPVQGDDIVLIINAHLLPLKWELARVLELIASKDGLVRTLRLRTKNTTCLRSIRQVSKLPSST